MSRCEVVVQNGGVATMDPERPGAYGAIEDGLVAVRDGAIVWVGPRAEAPAELARDAERVVDLAGGWITPGLVDPHTHLVFGGDRAGEFEERLAGATYEEIARRGGGILSTVRATRQASDEELLRSATARLDALTDGGVTTLEIKSGYGLDTETEVRMLRVARALGRRDRVTISTTLLAAHALPEEFRGNRTGYLDTLCEETIPTIVEAGLADQVDAFCESIAFSSAECARVLGVGADAGLGIRLHADQLTDGGGAALAASLAARSADHLEYTSEEGVDAMAAAGTVAVLLPGAYHFLGATRKPPVEEMRRAGVPMAVGTDLNPGSSPLLSPTLAMHLACVCFGLTPEEALAGMTVHAARVLDLEDRGRIAPGLRADLACWWIDRPAELAYWIGGDPCSGVVAGGAYRSIENGPAHQNGGAGPRADGG